MKLPSWLTLDSDWKGRVKRLLHQSAFVAALWAWRRLRLGENLDWTALFFLLVNPLSGTLFAKPEKPQPAVTLDETTIAVPYGREVEWSRVGGVRERNGLSLLDREGWPIGVIPYNAANIDDVLREVAKRVPHPEPTRRRRFGHRYSITPYLIQLAIVAALLAGVYVYSHDLWSTVAVAVVLLWTLPGQLRDDLREVATAQDDLVLRSVLRERRLPRERIRDVALTGTGAGLGVVGVLDDGERVSLNVPGVKPLDLFYAVDAWVHE